MDDDKEPEQRSLWPARTTDPNTSHEAAAAILEKIPELERRVLDALRTVLPKGMTQPKTAVYLDMQEKSITPRFRPLARKGLIYEAGFEIAPTGRRQIVWKARH